ncbi:tumor necrosis factor alpha-induced protein 3 isoform X2 [Channa argus]|uniref:tumor necrosis factor alpha-induced protein 3 isoform X2 n=1 Tax=Channa argus TaxID=215402 RepID=UPI003522B8AF
MSQGQNFLPKFLFVSNLLKAVKIRQRVPNDVLKPSASGGLMHHLRSMHRYTLEMIAMNHFPQAFREVVQAAILDRAMQISLEQEKKLNWCREVKKMVPLRTNGDGNCLLHAASQYMLGVQDTDLVLRKALHGVLKETDTGVFKARFQAELLQSQEFTQTGLRYTTTNWEEEWDKIVKMASPVSSSNGLQFDSLEDIHIFVLSNILRRPIIVIAEIRAVPLINPGRSGFEELKVHFLMEKEQQQKERLLKEYLLLIEIPIIGLGYDATRIMNAARLDEGNLPEDMNLMEDYLQLVNHEYQRWQEDKEQAWAAQPQRPPPFSVSQLSLIEIRCATPRCTFYVSVDTQPHCHECFEKRQATVGGGARIEGVVQTKGGGVQGGVGVTGGSETEVSSRGVRSSSPPSSSSGKGVVLSSPRSAPPTAPSLSLYSETHAMKCKTIGCLFTLSVEHDGLCERCFNSRQNHGPPGAGTAATGLPGPNGGPIVPQWGACETETERCSMCRQEVFRIFNGLCPPCMQKQQAPERGEPQQSNPRTEASASAWSQARDTERPCLTITPGHTSAWQTPLARPCKRSGCQFFGTPEKLGFCTICYVDYQTNHHLTPPPAPVQSRHGLEAGFQNASRCRGTGCGAVGKTMLEGYCDKCYVKEQSARLNQVAHRTPHSPPLVMRDRAAKPRSSQQSQTQTQCRRSGCSNVSPGCTDLCPECHTRGQGREAGRRAQAPKEKSKQRCRTQGCDHYANQEKQGYCNECYHFKQIYRG